MQSTANLSSFTNIFFLRLLGCSLQNPTPENTSKSFPSLQHVKEGLSTLPGKKPKTIKEQEQWEKANGDWIA
jgi:hypothetical protein